MQVCVAVQAWPQLPQLLLSVCVFTQFPLQQVCPSAHGGSHGGVGLGVGLGGGGTGGGTGVGLGGGGTGVGGLGGTGVGVGVGVG